MNPGPNPQLARGSLVPLLNCLWSLSNCAFATLATHQTCHTLPLVGGGSSSGTGQSRPTAPRRFFALAHPSVSASAQNVVDRGVTSACRNRLISFTGRAGERQC